MTKNQKRNAKQRIFDTAVSLFARKGYAGVGIREVAKKADVNISMINYYYSGKVGILKEIINQCYDKYYNAILNIGNAKTPLEERVRLLTHNLVAFFRNHTELAIVAFSVIPVEIPEIIDLRIKWIESNREATNRWFSFLGLDTKNEAQMCVMRSFLTSIVFGFFESRYCCDRVAQAPAMPIHVQEHLRHDDHAVELDNAFFDRYAESLGNIYLYGVTSIGKKEKKKDK